VLLKGLMNNKLETIQKEKTLLHLEGGGQQVVTKKDVDNLEKRLIK